MTYEYFPTNFRANCLRVVDGDTVVLFVDCGFHSYRQEKFRLLRVNTPEMRARTVEERTKAKEAKEYVEKVLAPSMVAGDTEWCLRVITFKDPDDFGRWLAEIYYKTEDGKEHCLNDDLLELGYAKPFVKK